MPTEQKNSMREKSTLLWLGAYKVALFLYGQQFWQHENHQTVGSLLSAIDDIGAELLEHA